MSSHRAAYPDPLSFERALQRIAESQPGCVPYESHRPIRIPGRLQGASLRTCLASLCPHVPAERWPLALAEGRLRVDGRLPNLDERAFGGMVVTYITHDRIEPEVATNIEVLHIDQDLVVLHKPAPLAVHPCGRFNRNTLLYFAEKAWPQEDLRPAHRIDAATTGILVLTRHKSAARLVQSQFQAREVHKTYLVRVEGTPAEDHFSVHAKINLAAGDHGRRRISEDGVPAHTDFEVATRLDDGTSLLFAHPISGRTNQIRLHLQDQGLPIVGDNAYGSHQDVDGGMVSATQPLHLHAYAIKFRHPRDGKDVIYRTSPPNWATHLL